MKTVGTPTKHGNRQTLFGAQRGQVVGLLEHIADPADPGFRQEISEPGGWVVSLDTTELVRSNAGFEVDAAIARITWGSGGTRNVLEVSVNPSSEIFCPGESVSVDILWDPDLPAVYDLPTSATISGLLRRGYGQTNARRMTWLPLTLAGHSLDVAVPAFAKDFQLIANLSADCAWSSEFLYAWGPGNAPTYSGLMMLKLLGLGQRAPVPAGVTKMIAQAVSDFNLDGDGNVNMGDPWGIDWGIEL